jgi:hypothetical protein
MFDISSAIVSAAPIDVSVEHCGQTTDKKLHHKVYVCPEIQKDHLKM